MNNGQRRELRRLLVELGFSVRSNTGEFSKDGRYDEIWSTDDLHQGNAGDMVILSWGEFS